MEDISKSGLFAVVLIALLVLAAADINKESVPIEKEMGIDTTSTMEMTEKEKEQNIDSPKAP